MRHTNIIRRFQKLQGLLSFIALAGVLTLGSCDKTKDTSGISTVTKRSATEEVVSGKETSPGKPGGSQVLTSVVTVAGIRPLGRSTEIEVYFNENTEFFTVTDATLIGTVKEALSNGKPLRVSFNPWEGTLITATAASEQDIAVVKSRGIVSNSGISKKIDFTSMTDDVINEPAAMGILNATDPGLNNLIPDFATAQLMFNYITRQCCAVPGPYGIDYCISFQYCQDGCYARAHKMCWIINNKYKYGTKKIFSFANAGSDKLCVQGQKWGGCCIRWWYHVAPLVTVQTITGPKAYVFDPAMFNQPVMLATWLHAQENPACAGGFTPHVTMINVQRTASYAPSGTTGMVFVTDPTYSSTNSVLTSYSALITCP